MHNIKRKGFTRDNFDEIVRYIDDRAYNLWIPPKICDTPTAVVATFAHVNSVPVWVMADAVTSGITCLIRKPDTWSNGTIRTFLYYSGDAAGNNFRLNARIAIYKVYTPVAGTSIVWNGDLLTAPSYAVNFFYTTPGPAAINQLTMADNQQGSPIDQSDELIVLFCNRIGADAADTNLGNFYFVGFQLVYTEGTREIGLRTS